VYDNYFPRYIFFILDNFHPDTLHVLIQAGRKLHLKALYAELQITKAAGWDLLRHYNKNQCFIVTPYIPAHIAHGNPTGADGLGLEVLSSSSQNTGQSVPLGQENSYVITWSPVK
jgi:hypothetical protein